MPDQITRLLDQIDRLDRDADPGPWDTDSSPYEVGVIYGAPRLEAGYVKRSILTNFIEGEVANADFIALSRTALPALAQAVRRLLEDHRMVTTSWGEEQCATCIIDAGATGADRMEWPCDIYTTITTALGEDE